MGRNIALVIGAFVVGTMLIAIGRASDGGTKASPAAHITQYVTQPPATVYATATVTVRPKRPRPASNTIMSQDGVYVVGANILPGTYSTSGANGSNPAGCYYALLSSTNTSDIIDNNIVHGPATITVGSGVKAVETQGCKTWHRDGA